MAGFTDGQIVALLTAAGAIIVGAVGQVAAKYGTFSNRQTELEKNLLEQVKLNAGRIDTIERERTALEASFRLQLEAAAAERRAIEKDFREQLRQVQKELEEMERTNQDLRHENWLLRHSAIGMDEIEPVKPPQVADAPETEREGE